jgi:hypothetical protein
MLLSFLNRRGDKQTCLCCSRIAVLYRHLQAYVNLAQKKWEDGNCLDRQKMDYIIHRTFYTSESAGINHEYTENKAKERERDSYP